VRAQIPSPLRIQVVGTSCSGKSTFAKKLSEILQVPYIELDALHWGANWQEADTQVFQARITNATLADSWIVDGSYGRKVGDTISDRRNLIIWIDIPFPIILFRFLKRSVRRWWTQELLWGGCRESLRNSLFQRDSLLIWIIKYHSVSRRKYLSILESPPSGTSIIRLKSAAEISDYLSGAINFLN
jgi:adenylate kinase family enzyme